MPTHVNLTITLHVGICTKHYNIAQYLCDVCVSSV